MSLDFDRSPDGEPTTPAGQTPVPEQQAPAAMGPAQPVGPGFAPASAPAGSEPAADDRATDETEADERTADEPAATESAAHEATATEATATEATATEATATEATADEPAETEPTASELTAYGSGVAPAWDAERDGITEVAADGPADRAADAHPTAGIEPTSDLDGPLLSDADELRASWQRIQAAFVDDPREAVADAAGLVEHAAQALVGALRLRQQQLRAEWDRDGMPDGVEYADSGETPPSAASPDGDGQAAADGPGTEQLRLLIQRYRVLFNSLCRP